MSELSKHFHNESDGEGDEWRELVRLVIGFNELSSLDNPNNTFLFKKNKKNKTM